MTLRQPTSRRRGLGIAVLTCVSFIGAVFIGSAARPATASSLSQLASHAALLGKSPAAQALDGRVVISVTDPSVATLTNALKTTGPPESADVTIDGFDAGGPYGEDVTMVFRADAKFCSSATCEYKLVAISGTLYGQQNEYSNQRCSFPITPSIAQYFVQGGDVSPGSYDSFLVHDLILNYPGYSSLDFPDYEIWNAGETCVTHFGAGTEPGAAIWVPGSKSSVWKLGANEGSADITWNYAVSNTAPAYELGVYTNFSSYVSMTAKQAITFGHAFFELIDRKAETVFVVGFYPKENITSTDPVSSILKNDIRTPWTWRIRYALTKAQYDAAYQVWQNESAAESSKNPPKDYDLFSTNCTWFAAEVARKAGQIMPDYTDGLDYPDPRVLRNSGLKQAAQWVAARRRGRCL